jgi:beta-glucosidase
MKLGDGSAKMIDVTNLLSSTKEGEWQSLAIPLSCFKQEGVDLAHVATPFAMEAGGPFRISIAGVRLDAQPPNLSCPSLVAAK